MLLALIATFGFAKFRKLGSAKEVRSWMHEGLWPIGLFFCGVLVGAFVRFRLGNSNVHDFAGGSAPIVAALLIAVLVPVNDEKRFEPAQQIAVMYLLVGAVAAAIGSFNANGWIFGLCFELILGAIATSIWLVWNILPSSPIRGS
jgi:hypothetical protein